MTLGGLAAAVGLVIDDAIVVVENIVMHRDSGESRGAAITRALSEIRVPLIGSTITPIVVFLPLVTLTGVEGTFFRALGITVGTALLTSLALALTWTPTLSHFLLRRQKAGHRAPTDAATGETVPAVSHGHATTGVMGKVTRGYVKTLGFALGRPIVLALGCAGLIVVSYFCYRALGSDLLPEMDEGGFVLDYLMPAGSSLADTNQVLLGVEKILGATEEVESTSRRTGLQLGLQAVTEANTGDFLVKLKDKRDRGIDEIISESSRQGRQSLSATRHRVRAGSSGPDRRSDEFARTDRNQAVLAGSEIAGQVGPKDR